MTDFVDSARYTEQVGDEAMMPWWSRHDQIARELLIRWGGLELERTDGFVAVFEEAEHAVSCSLAYQEALALSAFPLHARSVVHAGQLSLLEAPSEHLAIGAKRFEADGMAKIVAARMLAIACARQTLVTADVRFDATLASRSWRSHGFWLAKGLAEPFEVFEARLGTRGEEAPTDDRKCHRVVRMRDLWIPAREVQHSLPAERDAFVGRTQVLQGLLSSLESGARLISLCGMGGIGKTRLAIRFGWLNLAAFPGGVWFCDLSQVRSLDGLCSAVARGLGVTIAGGDPLDLLGRVIAGRSRSLVILDNFEQVTVHAEDTVGFWLDRAPEATFLITTRELTGVAGEHAKVVPTLSATEGLDLFVRRAVASQPTFALVESDQRAIEELVTGLDGLPLALELAAARVRVFSPPQLLKRLHERFDWLWSGHGRKGRQATLRAAFDWSWDLLSEAERKTMACLAVFEGGFDVAAVEGVVGQHGSVANVVSIVEALLMKSLLVPMGLERFQMLESVREYAAQQLRSDPAGPVSKQEAERWHWRYYETFGEERATGATADAANLVIACQRATAARDAPSAALCLKNAWHLIRLVGPVHVARDMALAVIGIAQGGIAERGVAQWVAAGACEALGEVTEAKRHVEAGLKLERLNREIEVRLLIARGERQTGDGAFADANRSFDVARAAASQLGDLRLEANVLMDMGKLLDQQGRLQDARGRYEQALLLAQAVRDLRLEGGILGNLGGVRHDLGQLVEARALYERSVEIAELVGDRRWAGNGRCNLGLLCEEQGDLAGAKDHLERAAQIAREIGHAALEYTVLCNLGILAEKEHRLEDARTSFAAAVAAANRAADRRAEGQFRGYLGQCLALLGQEDEAMRELQQADALLKAMDDRLSRAIVTCQRSLAARLAGRTEEADSALHEARRIGAELGVEPDSELSRRLRDLTSAQTISC